MLLGQELSLMKPFFYVSETKTQMEMINLILSNDVFEVQFQ